MVRPLALLLLLAQGAATATDGGGGVTFSALTKLGDFWLGGTTVNGVVEICPRSPPNLLPFTLDTLLCTANGTFMITSDGGKTWGLSGLPEELRPFIAPPPWRQRIGPAGKPTTASAIWVGVNPSGPVISGEPINPSIHILFLDQIIT